MEPPYGSQEARPARASVLGLSTARQSCMPGENDRTREVRCPLLKSTPKPASRTGSVSRSARPASSACSPRTPSRAGAGFRLLLHPLRALRRGLPHGGLPARLARARAVPELRAEDRPTAEAANGSCGRGARSAPTGRPPSSGPSWKSSSRSPARPRRQEQPALALDGRGNPGRDAAPGRAGDRLHAGFIAEKPKLAGCSATRGWSPRGTWVRAHLPRGAAPDRGACRQELGLRRRGHGAGLELPRALRPTSGWAAAGPAISIRRSTPIRRSSRR